jgi:cytochrome c biogenesis protein CcmG, thiol:disulfide interchange protein DsbE
MDEETPSSARQKPAQAILPLVVVGVGLILLGLGALLLFTWPRGEGRTGSQISDSASAIPQAVNYPAPDLRLDDLQGQPVSLAEQRGRWVLVNNWATWCPPCKAEMPTLQAYLDQHRNQNFTIIAIEAGESVAEVADFVQKYKLGFTVWPDPDEKVYAAFRNPALPTSWVIDPQGQVRLTWVGAISRERLEKYVTPLLEE